MFVCSVGISGNSSSEETTTFKLSTVNATTAISSIRHYYSGSTKKYSYLYLTTTGIRYVREATGGNTYSNVTAIFYYKELK